MGTGTGEPGLGLHKDRGVRTGVAEGRGGEGMQICSRTVLLFIHVQAHASTPARVLEWRNVHGSEGAYF